MNFKHNSLEFLCIGGTPRLSWKQGQCFTTDGLVCSSQLALFRDKTFHATSILPYTPNDSVATSNIQRLAWTSNKNNFPQLDALLIHMDKYTVTTIYVSNWTRYQKYNGRGKGRVATLGSGLGQVGDRHRQPMQGFL